MTPEQHITFITIPNTRTFEITTRQGFALIFFIEKTTEFEVCPKCCVKSFSVYDRRLVTLTDAPLRNGQVQLVVRKRRFTCPKCALPFTEPLEGVRKGARKTERFKRSLCDAAQKYLNLETVRREFRCSSSTLYKAVYEHFGLRLRMRQRPFPEVIGIDEHAFKYDSKGKFIRWNTVIADHSKKTLFDVVEGRTIAELKNKLECRAGRENVKFITMDLSTTYRSAAKDLFPNAEIVADRFHVVKLLNEGIKAAVCAQFPKKERPEIARALFKNVEQLRKDRREALMVWLLAYPKISKLHAMKEEMRRIFRSNVIYEKKRGWFTRLLDESAKSPHPELRSLRETLFKWRTEVMAAMKYKWSNGRLEGFNSKAKLVKRTAYGFRNFENFRLRFMNACF